MSRFRDAQIGPLCDDKNSPRASTNSEQGAIKRLEEEKKALEAEKSQALAEKDALQKRLREQEQEIAAERERLTTRQWRDPSGNGVNANDAGTLEDQFRGQQYRRIKANEARLQHIDKDIKKLKLEANAAKSAPPKGMDTVDVFDFGEQRWKGNMVTTVKQKAEMMKAWEDYKTASTNKMRGSLRKPQSYEDWR